MWHTYFLKKNLHHNTCSHDTTRSAVQRSEIMLLGSRPGPIAKGILGQKNHHRSWCLRGILWLGKFVQLRGAVMQLGLACNVTLSATFHQRLCIVSFARGPKQSVPSRVITLLVRDRNSCRENLIPRNSRSSFLQHYSNNIIIHIVIRPRKRWNLILTIALTAVLLATCDRDGHSTRRILTTTSRRQEMMRVIQGVVTIETKAVCNTLQHIELEQEKKHCYNNDYANDQENESKDDAINLILEWNLQKLDLLEPQIPTPLDPNHLVLRNVFYLHGLFDQAFLGLLSDLAESLPGSTESHNMIATRRFFESERLGAAIMERLPRCLGLQRVLPSMRFIE